MLLRLILKGLKMFEVELTSLTSNSVVPGKDDSFDFLGLIRIDRAISFLQELISRPLSRSLQICQLVLYLPADLVKFLNINWYSFLGIVQLLLSEDL